MLSWRGGGRWFSQMWKVMMAMLQLRVLRLLSPTCAAVSARARVAAARADTHDDALKVDHFVKANNTLIFDPTTGGQGGEGMTNSGQWWIENVLEVSAASCWRYRCFCCRCR